jgi:two-component SAPR family response regulator
MPLIVVDRDRYRIDWRNMWADAHAFREALAEAKRANDPVPYLKDAVDLYRGDFCKDAYFGWTEDERYGLERSYINAVLKLADTLIERDTVEEAHSIVDRAMGIDPYSDALARLAIRLDARRVGRAAAFERFGRFRTALRDINVEPEPETLSLVRSLKESDEQK